MFKSLREDVESIQRRDPAARSTLEVLLCYPGLHALFWYRIAHALWRKGLVVLARFVSHLARLVTGIEIHPGATIGRRLFIDHGMGVVIGETAVIGDDVTLYQGVTLGGTALHQGKRHPTLEDGVVVGSGAMILGPHTIGQGARIGANAVVIGEVPKGVTMVGIPARIVMRRPKEGEKDFVAYGLPDEEMPDPLARAVEGLQRQLAEMGKRIEELEGRADRSGEAAPFEDRARAGRG